MNILKSLLNLFLHINCPLCERSTPNEICSYCVQQLQIHRHQNPSFLWKQPLPIFAWGVYSGALKRAIAATKYENQPQIARILGQWLGKAWLFDSPPLDVQQILVVPIPLHSDKLKSRSYNQAALIAEGFSQITGCKLLNILERVKNTQVQYGLSPTQREKNLRDAFVVKKAGPNRLNTKVLLVDDIYTTGATANSARAALVQSSISVLGIAVVAGTPIPQNRLNGH